MGRIRYGETGRVILYVFAVTLSASIFIDFFTLSCNLLTNRYLSYNNYANRHMHNAHCTYDFMDAVMWKKVKQRHKMESKQYNKSCILFRDEFIIHCV